MDPQVPPAQPAERAAQVPLAGREPRGQRVLPEVKCRVGLAQRGMLEARAFKGRVALLAQLVLRAPQAAKARQEQPVLLVARGRLELQALRDCKVPPAPPAWCKGHQAQPVHWARLARQVPAGPLVPRVPLG